MVLLTETNDSLTDFQYFPPLICGIILECIGQFGHNACHHTMGKSGGLAHNPNCLANCACTGAFFPANIYRFAFQPHTPSRAHTDPERSYKGHRTFGQCRR